MLSASAWPFRGLPSWVASAALEVAVDSKMTFHACVNCPRDYCCLFACSSSRSCLFTLSARFVSEIPLVPSADYRAQTSLTAARTGHYAGVPSSPSPKRSQPSSS